MANLYVRSTDGSDADNGSTWALAKATLAGAAAIDVAGDTIYVSQSHNESTAASISLAFAGNGANPTKVICGDDSSEPPTSVSNLGAVSTGAGAYDITFTGGAYFVRGLTFTAGVGSSSTARIILTNTTSGFSFFENCTFRLNSSGTSSRINLGTFYTTVKFKDVFVRFGAAGQAIGGNASCYLQWDGGGLESGGTSPTALFLTTSLFGVASGLDLSAASSSINIFQASGQTSKFILRNSKLPSSWSGSLVSGTLVLGDRLELHNCDSGDTNYRLWIEDYSGSIKTETTIVRSGGASDGTTSYSWKLASSANAEYPLLPLVTPEIAIWNDTTGSSKTVTVEIVTDGVTLTDGECWLEVQYLGTSGYPISSFVSDAKADVLATASNQTSSSETWTTTGLSSPVKQSLSVTYTPQEKGFFQAVVKLAKASTTVYVDPKLVVT